jgi:hypothetical protein
MSRINIIDESFFDDAPEWKEMFFRRLEELKSKVINN